MAVQAQIWCDKLENKEEMAQIVLSLSGSTSAKNIVERAKGNFDFGDGRVEKNSPYIMKFWSNSASYPYKSHDLWFVTEDTRWGYFPENIDVKKLVDAVNREDLWKEAAKSGQEAAIPKKVLAALRLSLMGSSLIQRIQQAI